MNNNTLPIIYYDYVNNSGYYIIKDNVHQYINIESKKWATIYVKTNI